MERTLGAEREHLLRQLARGSRGGIDLLERRELLLACAPPRQVGVVANGDQQVVELVRDAA